MGLRRSWILVLLVACDGSSSSDPPAPPAAGVDEEQAEQEAEPAPQIPADVETRAVWRGRARVRWFDQYSDSGCPRHQWVEEGLPDPFPDACGPFQFERNYRNLFHEVVPRTLDGEDKYESFFLTLLTNRYGPDPGDVLLRVRYPASECTAQPTVGGLDYLAPGYGGGVGVSCGSQLLDGSGVALAVTAKAAPVDPTEKARTAVPLADADTPRTPVLPRPLSAAVLDASARYDDALDFWVEPGSERLSVALPPHGTVPFAEPDRAVHVNMIAVLGDGAPVRLRGGTAPEAWSEAGRPMYNTAWVGWVDGDCGRLDVDLESAWVFTAQGSFPGFDVEVGWGGGSVELYPGTALTGVNRLKVGSAGRLVLPSDVSARVKYPEGWKVECFEVDDPACDTWGPGSLSTTENPDAVIQLEGPRGVVVLMASPWPADVPCPNVWSGIGGTPYPLGQHLDAIAEGRFNPACMDGAGGAKYYVMDTATLPNPMAQPPTLEEGIARAGPWARCLLCDVPEGKDRYPPVQRVP